MNTICCVYCHSHKSLAEFTTEHVVPQSFGGFKDALTLTDAVCGTCNQYFGDTLDRILARESFEGLYRYETGATSPDRAKKFRSGRTVLKLAEAGEYDDVLLMPAHDDRSPTSIVMQQVNQVGFKDEETGRWTSYPEWELERDDWTEKARLHKGQEIRILSSGDEAYEHIKALLKRHSFDFRETAPMMNPPAPGEEISVKAIVDIDDLIKRAAAKICFNYMTAIHGRRFALLSAFNDLRAYVRYGVTGSPAFVHPTTDPILTDDVDADRRVNGHLLTVGWSKGQGGILGQLSLFNQLTYRVILTTAYSGEKFSIESGHLYSVGGWQVIALGHLPLDEYKTMREQGQLPQGE